MQKEIRNPKAKWWVEGAGSWSLGVDLNKSDHGHHLSVGALFGTASPKNGCAGRWFLTPTHSCSDRPVFQGDLMDFFQDAALEKNPDIRCCSNHFSTWLTNWGHWCYAGGFGTRGFRKAAWSQPVAPGQLVSQEWNPNQIRAVVRFTLPMICLFHFEVFAIF